MVRSFDIDKPLQNDSAFVATRAGLEINVCIRLH